MDVPWGLVAFLVGLAYGALKTGRQDKSQLLKTGLIIGLVVGIVLAVIGILTNAPALGFGGFLWTVFTALILTLLFVLGVWVGDLLTGARRRTA
jgi:Mg/Co/Ni transporter MgtE